MANLVVRVFCSSVRCFYHQSYSLPSTVPLAIDTVLDRKVHKAEGFILQ